MLSDISDGPNMRPMFVLKITDNANFTNRLQGYPRLIPLDRMPGEKIQQPSPVLSDVTHDFYMIFLCFDSLSHTAYDSGGEVHFAFGRLSQTPV